MEISMKSRFWFSLFLVTAIVSTMHAEKFALTKNLVTTSDVGSWMLGTKSHWLSGKDLALTSDIGSWMLGTRQHYRLNGKDLVLTSDAGSWMLGTKRHGVIGRICTKAKKAVFNVKNPTPAQFVKRYTAAFLGTLGLCMNYGNTDGHSNVSSSSNSVQNAVVAHSKKGYFAMLKEHPGRTATALSIMVALGYLAYDNDLFDQLKAQIKKPITSSKQYDQECFNHKK